MKFGTGWLGWTEQETLDTPIVVIELAMAGYFERVKYEHTGEFTPSKIVPAEPAAKPTYAQIVGALRAYANADPRRKK